MYANLTMVALDLNGVVQPRNRFWSIFCDRAKGPGLGDVNLPRRMQIADEVSSVLMHMAMQTETNTGRTQTFEEGIVLNLLIAGSGMMPDGNAEDIDVWGQRPSFFRFLCLLVGFQQAFRKRTGVDAGASFEELVDLPRGIHRQELEPRFREKEREILLIGFQWVRLLDERMIEFPEILKAQVILLLVPDEVPITLARETPGLLFLLVNEALLFPVIYRLIPAQVMIAGHDNATLSRQFESFDELRNELIGLFKLFRRSAVGQIARDDKIVQPFETQSILLIRKVTDQRL